MPKETKILLSNKTKADSVIHENMTPDDLAGIFKENRGVKIFKKDGKLYDHRKEGDQANNAIKNTIHSIEDRIIELNKAGQYNSTEEQLLQEKLSRLSKFKDLYNDLRRENICLISSSKPKP